MSKKYERMRRERRAKRWILLRYAMPLISIVLTLIFMAIPSLQYINNQSGTNDPISAFTLMGNSWDQVRTYLFGTADQTNGNIIFSRTVLILLIVFWVLFLVSLAVAIWSMWAGFRYANRESEMSRGRLWFITLIPNRIFLSVYGALMIPLAAFPRILIGLYRNLYVSVTLEVHGLEPLWCALILSAGTAVLSAVTLGFEREWRMDPFRRADTKKEMPEKEEESEVSAEPFEDEDEQLSDARREYREQVDRVAALFLLNDEKNDNEKK